MYLLRTAARFARQLALTSPLSFPLPFLPPFPAPAFPPPAFPSPALPSRADGLAPADAQRR